MHLNNMLSVLPVSADRPHPKGSPRVLGSSHRIHPHSPPDQSFVALETINLLSVSMNIPTLDISYTQSCAAQV